MTKVDILFPCPQAMEVFKKQEEGEHPLSHLCKICSKRFVSGRALGVHMTAHAPASMASDTLGETEFQKGKRPSASDEESMEEKDAEEGLYGNGSKFMDYALRKNPKCSWRFADQDNLFQLDHGFDSKPIDSSLNCDLSREEFSSSKGLMCQSETHQDSGDAHLEESESQKHETQDQEEERSENEAEIEIDHPSGNSSRFDKWMKGKRSKKPRYATQLKPPQQFCSETNTEEEDMAICLVMLASGVHTTQYPKFQVGADEPGSCDFKLPIAGSQRPKKKPKKIDGDAGFYEDDKVKKASYKCITCNKVFHSYQALGGHRASHNKVKCCVSQIKEQSESLEEEITDEKLITGSNSQLPRYFHKPSPKERTKDPCVKDTRDEKMTSQPASFSGKKSRVHECSICHRLFASGQALGGHKRCHWGTAGASDTINTISSSKETPMLLQQQKMPARLELLDLNLPAPVDDDSDTGNLNHVDGNAVDSLGASFAQTHSSTQFSKDDEADSRVGKEIGFNRDCDSDFPVRGQSWLQL